MINPQMLLQLLPLIKGNPAQFMQQYGLNSQGMDLSNPQNMAMNLAQQGFVDQSTLNMAQQVAQQMGYKL